MQTRNCIRAAWLFSFLFCLQAVCSSQAYKYRFRIINLPEDFKNQYISLVEEDAAGMLWFVTSSGLHRYDGNQVLTFDMQSKPALPEDEIEALLADSKDQVWIITLHNLVRFDLRRWSTQVVPFRRSQAPAQSLKVSAIAEGKDGTLYASCGSRLYRISRDSLEYITDITPYVTGTTSPPLINSICEPTYGQLLLTTADTQVISIRHRQMEWATPVSVELRHPTPAKVPAPVVGTTQKYLLYLGLKGLYVVDLATATATRLLTPPGIHFPPKTDLSLAELDGKQAIIYYSNLKKYETGMVLYHADRDSFVDLGNRYPAILRSNTIRHTTAKNGHLLIPIKAGIAMVTVASSPFDVFGASLDNVNSIRTLYKEPNGNLLVGSYLYNFVRFNENTSTRSRISGHAISCILPWHKDTMLMGSEGVRFAWYLPASGRLVHLSVTGPLESVNPYINCLARESDTTFWAGTYTGFYLINPYTNQVLQSSSDPQNPLLQPSMVYDILKLGKVVFFATHQGLFTWNEKNNTWSRLLSGKGGRYAYANFTCLRSVNKEIWAGTAGNGLLVLDTGGHLLRTITTSEGLAGNTVFSIVRYNNIILAGTRTGLSIINTVTGKINNYSSEYYLPADEFNRSAWCVQGDTVYLGTLNGFIRIDMKRLSQQPAPLASVICFSSFTFSHDGGSRSDYTIPYRHAQRLTISPDVTNFSIGLGGLSEMADGLKLYYRLSTHSPWQDIGQRREITFVNMAPDDYTMQIATRLPDGQWMKNVLTLPIIVQPHFYQTWWWKLFVVLVLAGLIWLVIRYQERALRKEERLRSRIAGDLHDEVGSALTRIYFQAGMLGTPDTKSTAPQASTLQNIASSSREALSSMSDMVWSIDAHYDNALDMVDRIRDYIARLQEELEWTCLFSVSGSYDQLRLSQVVRQNILLIFKEGLNNAIKYGYKETIAVHLVLNKQGILLQITNQIRPTEAQDNSFRGGHGLKSMQLRADKIKATLSVTQTGDRFELQLDAKPL